MTEAQTTKTDIPGSDISSGGWLARNLPAPLLPYARLMRLDRPIGTWLLLWPGLWALALAGAGVAFLPQYILFCLGAVVMRGAGCTYNDIVDRDIDVKVTRTAVRPLPSGQVKLWQAVTFLILQLVIGLVILLQFNTFAIVIGAASLLLVFSYPFMKRITYWPQAWLGLTFNWGALLGWAVARGEIAWPALLLYLGGIAWTLGYDTIYAHQDREDDALVGVKSSALALGDKTVPAIAGFYGLALLLFTVAIVATGMNIAVVVALMGAAAHATWQVVTLDINDSSNCLTRFRANRDFGLFVMLAILAARL